MIFSYAFRPFFLAAGSWAVVAMILWLATFEGHLRLPTHFQPVVWHIHEMLFGFVLAAITGFLLTAIPNWTKRQPVAGNTLAILVALWLVGRIVCLFSAKLAGLVGVVADFAFPAALIVVTGNEILAARNWRNFPIVLLLGVFAIADVLIYLEAYDFAVPHGLGIRLALAVPILLIGVIGGRIVPNFSRNWLVQRAAERLPSPPNRFDTVAATMLQSSLLLWVVLPDSRIIGLLLILAAIVNGLRMSRWAGYKTLAEPLLFILHVGYFWVVAGIALLGLSVIRVGIPNLAAIHALTAGAMGTMILAVMPRVTLGHTGRALSGNGPTTLMFVLINVAAIGRIAASWNGRELMILLILSGACWIAAFALFDAIYGPLLLAPREVQG